LAELKYLSPHADLIGADFVNLAMKIQLDAEESSLIGVFSSSYREQSPLFIFNLAKSLSSIGHRVAVVDLDLFAPILTQNWGFQGTRGIYEMLQDRTDFAGFSQMTALPGVDFVGAGNRGMNIPSKALHHQHLIDQLGQMVKAYDYVLINLPSLKQGQEAWPLLKRCDRCLLPVQKGRTARKALGTWEALLDLHKVKKGELVYINPSRSKKDYFSINTRPL